MEASPEGEDLSLSLSVQNLLHPPEGSGLHPQGADGSVAAGRWKWWTASSSRPGDVCRCASSADLPVVEKLQLPESMASSGEEQELEEEEAEEGEEEEEELRRFRELKHKMILLDEAELGSATPARSRNRCANTGI